jgi:hypothetical protein
MSNSHFMGDLKLDFLELSGGPTEPAQIKTG